MKSSASTANGQEVPSSVVTKLTVLGATGSIGLNTLEIVRQFPQKFKIEALSCRSSIERLVEQIKEFQPRLVCVDNSEQARELRETFREGNSGTETEFVWGVEGLVQVSSDPEVDLVVAGIVGAAGLQPTFSAVQAGKTVAVANKEPLVMAGELFVQTANKTGAKLLPTDSEHNAIFQVLHGEPPERIARLILTASGGPFRDLPLKEFEKITPAEALSHPNWEMGRKISIDSATMMNKGLEIIEAHWLFNTPVENIDVLMQRESIIHSMVEFIDGSFLAQMGLPDMRVPIAYCLGWPERLPLKIPRLDPLSMSALHFEKIDPQRYPCLPLAIKVAKQGGAAPAVLNGANETVVTAFLGEEIRFVEIAETIAAVIKDFEKALHQVDVPSFLRKICTLEDAEHADKWGRKQASKILESII
ncbi:MAG: 1-deoxy-D-xylulose-5-phosphate reductoisomerase [SAR324 cluster bacterium]|uniref:1-deoxy-D-xylulose 5-phosphate reductoisomerase n=1 Tax=SAR324 cluster bacterium TaxID=2024889 RepID=A0A432H1X4_9DELT|nr:MAG: 1-deoxy-D-xylulose-5-phosphate reductoisomerase [SAR324 cluster bacterium]